MISRQQLTPTLVITSLRSTVCPACAGAKGAKKTLCFKCYYALPGEMRNHLYRLVGQGYEDALHAALDFLGAETFHQEQRQ